MKITEIVLDGDEEHQKALDNTGFWGKQAAGAIIMAKNTGRILLSHRSAEVLEPHTWGVWGGAIDGGESPVNGATREALEELGDIAIERKIPLYVFKSGDFRYSNFLFIVGDEFTPRPKPEHAWETDGYTWVTVGDWPDPLHPGLVALFGDPASMEKINTFMKLVVDKQ